MSQRIPSDDDVVAADRGLQLVLWQEHIGHGFREELKQLALALGFYGIRHVENGWELAGVDLEARFARVSRTKNGHPIGSVLSAAAKAELSSLKGQNSGELVFGKRAGQPFHYRKLWEKVPKEAGFNGYDFHLLRHSCGSALASAVLG